MCNSEYSFFKMIVECFEVWMDEYLVIHGGMCQTQISGHPWWSGSNSNIWSSMVECVKLKYLVIHGGMCQSQISGHPWWNVSNSNIWSAMVECVKLKYLVIHGGMCKVKYLAIHGGMCQSQISGHPWSYTTIQLVLNY